MSRGSPITQRDNDCKSNDIQSCEMLGVIKPRYVKLCKA
jgi:hypothetical protein